MKKINILFLILSMLFLVSCGDINKIHEVKNAEIPHDLTKLSINDKKYSFPFDIEALKKDFYKEEKNGVYYLTDNIYLQYFKEDSYLSYEFVFNDNKGKSTRFNFFDSGIGPETPIDEVENILGTADYFERDDEKINIVYKIDENSKVFIICDKNKYKNDAEYIDRIYFLREE